ncbi:MAG: hypothetical protein C0404_09465 [Verrucomicrobia bacterium]|nr:hypothetical protein [Verrucomicrobiota bacterium]
MKGHIKQSERDDNMRKLNVIASAALATLFLTTIAARAGAPLLPPPPPEEPKGSSVRVVSHLPPAGTLDPSLQNEVRQAISRGLAWLAANQKPDGSWSDNNFPALTALPLMAFAAADAGERKPVIDKAVKYILSCVQTNGSICKDIPGRKGGGLPNYNTAICMVALHSVNPEAHTKVILDARKFVAGAQYFGDDEYKGGFGYDKDTKRAYTDALNTFYATEAIKTTAGREDKRDPSEKKVDINWDETVKYIARMQNKPEAGEDAGGMYYNPTDPKAGMVTNKEGKVCFRSYGSITYAGMLALVHANVSRDDVRVKSAFDWASRNWTVDENPGMGQDALFFFLNVLTKSLAAYGQDVIPGKDGKTINWKSEVAKKLVSIQSVEPSGQGYWENKVNRYWESDKVLCTAYSIIALEKLLK